MLVRSFNLELLTRWMAWTCFFFRAFFVVLMRAAILGFLPYESAIAHSSCNKFFVLPKWELFPGEARGQKLCFRLPLKFCRF